MEKPVCVSKTKCFDGWLEFYQHESSSVAGEMKFSVFLPASASTQKLPVLYFLGGLENSEENFMMKSGAQRVAASQNIILVCPDTSPRRAGVAGEKDSWNLGVGAAYYVNATEKKWAKNYRMYDYVLEELPNLLKEHFPVDVDRQSISGFSMGGHGALVLGLRNPGRYRAVSAFAPIAAPSLCPWGINAFSSFLGSDRDTWKTYDANELIQTVSTRIPVLIDQGTEDKFLSEQLLLDVFETTARKVDYPAIIRRREGYGHNYYFVATFIEEHITYHANKLKSGSH